MSLPDAIKITRQKAFLSQEAFAKDLQVSVVTINRWETGKSRPNLHGLKTIKQFCEANNLPFEDIETQWFESSNKGEM